MERQGRNVGDLGEDDFQRWCTLNHLERTKSCTDRMGWDYLVEFKPRPDKGVALDAQNELKKALVQVKASDRNQRSVMAKLSAFKRLVDADMPAFVLSIHYSGGITPQWAWLLHIGEAQIEAILRKVRLHESKGRRDLHNVKLRLPLDDAICLQVDGGDLGIQLETCIGTSVADYIAVKAAFRRACGYDETPFVGSVQLAPNVGLAEIADWQIGRLPHLQLEGGTVSKMRFGITLDKETHHFGASLATTEVKTLMKGLLTVSSVRHGASVEMEADMFASNPSLGDNVWRMRLANQFIDVFIPSHEAWTVEFNIDPDRQFALSDLVQALKLGWLLSEQGSSFSVSISGRIVEQEVPAAELAHFRNLYAFADRFSTALHQHRPDLRPRLTVKEIEEAMWANERAFSLLSQPGFGLSFAVMDAADLADAGGAAKTGIMLLPLCMSLKGIVYHAVVRIESSVHTDGPEVHLIGAQPLIVDDGIALEHNRPGLAERMAKRVGQLRSQENNKGRMVVGFQEMIVGLSADEDAGACAITWQEEGQD